MVSIRNRRQRRPLSAVHHTGRADIPTPHGMFTAHAYQDGAGLEHLAYASGDPASIPAPLVRVHSECLTGDVLASLRCDCGSQLTRALELVSESGCGLVLYVRGHEGRGIGLGHKLQAYELQDSGLDTVEANHALGFPTDARDYGIAAAVLADLGITRVRLLSNNPAKSEGLSHHGIEVVERVPLMGITTNENLRYLQTKGQRMNHTIDTLDSSGESGSRTG